jgi:AraC family transcriptional regulator, exoenzyme S synthesis regulatory protein ExsA
MNYKLNSEQDWRELARQANWSVAELARLCGVCARTLERHFQERYQQTPEHWLAEQRWQAALELLLEGGSPKVVGAELGYRHVGNFSREFKKRFGRSPAAFAKYHAAKPLPGQMSQKDNKLSH